MFDWKLNYKEKYLSKKINFGMNDRGSYHSFYRGKLQ